MPARGQFVFLVSLTDQGNLSGDIKDEIIVTKPIKALSLYNATRAADVTGRVIQQRRKVAGKMDARYAEVSRCHCANQISCSCVFLAVSFEDLLH